MFHQRPRHTPKRPFLFLTLALLLAFSNTIPILAQEATPPAEPPGDPPIPTLEAPPPPPPTDPPLPPTEPPPPPTDVPPPTAIPTESPTTTPTEPPTSTATDSPTAADGATATATGAFVGMPTETGTATPTATETLVGTPTATLTATPFPPEPPLALLYSDNFDSGALYVWNVGAGWTLAPSENGLALQASNTLEPVAFAHATLLDAAAEARFQLQGGGVQFHLRQSSVGAYTALVTADGQVALSRAGVPLAGAAIAPVAPDQWIAVRLSAIGEVIRVAVNGVEVITAVDPIPLPPGTVAFASTGSSLLVDEFRLWQVASAMPAVAFPTPTATLFPEPELGLIFTNDFSVVDFGYWSWGADWTFVPRADQLALETAGQSEATLLWGAMRDIALEARFQLHAGALAVHLRQSEAGRYSAEVDTSGVLRLYRNGQAFGTAQTEVTPGVWHHLRFSAIDDRLRVSLDGVEVLAVVDPAALPAGGVTLAGQPDGLLRIGDVSAWQPHAVLAAAMVPNAPTSLDASSAALTTQTTSDERIVFNSYRDGDPEIFILDPLACSVGVDCPATQLTFNAVADNDPRLSPDGQSIAYTSVIDGNYEIYVMNVDGSNNRRLTNHTATDDDPTWSPDGSQIAFASSRSGDYDIYLINADGSSPCGANPCRLTTTSDYERGPAWSSSGIAFYAGVNTELYLMNADGSGRRQLTSSNSVDQNPAWSPDGNWLAFTTNRYGNLSNYDIAKLDIRQCATPATCPVTRLTTDVNGDSDASWSPDGTQLAFTSSRNGFDQIYVMNADGSNQTRLTYTNFNRHPDWGSSPLFCTPGAGVMGMQGVSSAICLPLETPTPTPTVTPTLTPTVTPVPGGNMVIGEIPLPFPAVSSDLLAAADAYFDGDETDSEIKRVLLPMSLSPGICTRDGTALARQACSAYAYVAFYALFEEYTGVSPTLWDLVAVVYARELGDFGRDIVAAEAFTRNFFDGQAGACRPINNDYVCSYDYVIEWLGTMHAWYAAVKPDQASNTVEVDLLQLLLDGRQEFKLFKDAMLVPGGIHEFTSLRIGIFAFDTFIDEQIRTNLSTWGTGQSKNDPSIWGNQVVQPPGTRNIANFVEYNPNEHFSVVFWHILSPAGSGYASDVYIPGIPPQLDRDGVTCTYVAVISSTEGRISLSNC